MIKISQQIKILDVEEMKLLHDDKLPKDMCITTGLYLTETERGNWIASDWSSRQVWLENFPETGKKPKGFIKKFENPLSAIDWLRDIRDIRKE